MVSDEIDASNLLTVDLLANDSKPISQPLFPERRRDYERFRSAIFGQETDYVPLAEMFVENDVKAGLLGHPIRGHADEVKFWSWAGYDYYPISLSVVNPGRAIGGTSTGQSYSVYPESYTERSWAQMKKGVITTREEFANYQWPQLDQVKLSALDEIASLLPDGMKIMVILGKLFTGNWLMQGMETFFLNVVDDLELVELLYDKICSLQWEVFDRVIAHSAVGGIWNPDDFANRENTLLKPSHFRKYCFPTYKRMGQVCRQLGKPMILHSDGNIAALLNDVLDAGFNGFHPVEAKAMDIFQLKRTYGDRLALLGNVDLDVPLSRGTPQEVDAEVKRLITGLAPGGRYLISAGNSIPEYVPLPNYKALLHASHRYGKYPIAA